MFRMFSSGDLSSRLKVAKNKFKYEKAEQSVQYKNFKARYYLKKKELKNERRLARRRIMWKEPHLSCSDVRHRVNETVRPQQDEVERMKRELGDKKNARRTNISRISLLDDKSLIKGKVPPVAESTQIPNVPPPGATYQPPQTVPVVQAGY